MSAPNIQSINNIYSRTAYLTPTVNTSVVLLANAAPVVSSPAQTVQASIMGTLTQQMKLKQANK